MSREENSYLNMSFPSAKALSPPAMPPSPQKHPPSKWDTPVSLISSAKEVSEDSRKSPDFPVNSLERFPRFVGKGFSSFTSHSLRAGPLSSTVCSQREGNSLLNNLSLLFFNVLPSVLLSIVCITLTEAANLLQRLANHLQASNGNSTEKNLHGEDPASDGDITPRTPRLYHHGSLHTPTFPNPRTDMFEDGVSSSIKEPSDQLRTSAAEQSRRTGIRNLIEELAIELSHSKNPSQAEQVVTSHVQACKGFIQPHRSFRSPPQLPESPCLSSSLGEPSLKTPGMQVNPFPIEDVVSRVETVDIEDSESSAFDIEDSESSASSSSVVVSTQYSDEHRNGSNYNDIPGDELADETGPPSFDLRSPLFLPLSSSPATVKTEPFSRVESPILLPSPLPASQRFVAVCAEAFPKENGLGFENTDYNRDSLIEAMRVTSVSERTAHEAPRSPAASENSQPTTYQSISVVEDYDSDKMIVSMRTVKSDRSVTEKINELRPDSQGASDCSNKIPSHEPTKKTACALRNIDEFDVEDSAEPIDEDAVIVNLDVEKEESENKVPKNDQEARSQDQRPASLNPGGLRTTFFQNRQRSSVNFTNLEDGLYSTIVRSKDLLPNRQQKLIPLQSVGRSQSSAEKPMNDWPEVTPYEADKESRLSRRHLSDLSFGVKERQKDMLPRELVPDDFPSDDDESQHQEPAMERFGAKGWKRGLVSACKDVSECRRLVRNLWRRRKRGSPIEEGLGSATGMYRTDSHRGSQIRRNVPYEMGVKFDSELSQETVFTLLVRHCPECGVTVVARKPNHKLKITVPIPGQTRALLLSVHLTNNSHTRGTTVILTRSRDDQSGAARKHIEITSHALRRKLEEHLEYIEDSFSSSLLDESSRFY